MTFSNSPGSVLSSRLTSLRRYQVFRLLNVHYVRARELINFFAADTPAFVGRSSVPNVEIHHTVSTDHFGWYSRAIGCRPPLAGSPGFQTAVRTRREVETQPSREAGLGPAVKTASKMALDLESPARET